MVTSVDSEPWLCRRTVPFECAANSLVHLVATWTDARSDGGDQIPGSDAFPLQRINGGLNGAAGRATPTGVDGCNGPLTDIGQKDGHAVGHANRHGTLRVRGKNDISLQRCLGHIAWTPHHDVAAMDLTHADHLGL